MIEVWQILVPTEMNGKAIHTRFHRVWDAKVRKIAGGLTIWPPTIGYWVDPASNTIKERMIPVEIRCTEAEIKQISDISAKYYKQQAMYVKCLTTKSFIWHYDSKGNPI